MNLNHRSSSRCAFLLVSLAACGGGTGTDAGTDAGRDASADTGVDLPSADTGIDMPSVDTGMDMPSVDTGIDMPSVDLGTDATTCGDGLIDPGEACDGPNLGGHGCVSEGFGGGTLGCLPTCLAFDTSLCTAGACGDGVVDSGEVCDSSDLNGQTCIALGFAAGGTLACAPSCTTFDTRSCLSGAENCTNGTDDDGDGDVDCADADCISGPDCT